METNTNIIEAGAVIDDIPFSGFWRPCIRRNGEMYGAKIGPRFASEAEAAEFAIAVMDQSNLPAAFQPPLTR